MQVCTSGSSPLFKFLKEYEENPISLWRLTRTLYCNESINSGHHMPPKS